MDALAVSRGSRPPTAGIDGIAGQSVESLLGGPSSGARTGVQRAAAPKAKKKQTLNEQYGLRPRRYTRQLDGKRSQHDGFDQILAERERRVLADLPNLVAKLNAICESKKVAFRFAAAELAENFISDGGYYLLTEEGGAVIDDTDIDDYAYLGVDTFLDRQSELDPWMSDDLRQRAKEPAAAHTQTNDCRGARWSEVRRPVPKGTYEIANPYDNGRVHIQHEAFEATVLAHSHQAANP